MIYFDDDMLLPEVDDEIIGILPRWREPRHYRLRIDHFQEWNDEQFRQRFRLSKETVSRLYETIKDDIDPATDRNQAVSGINRLLLTLRFYATGSFLMCSGDFSGVSPATTGRVVHLISHVIASLGRRFIKMPTSREEITRCRGNFFNMARFPRVIGVVDCTHIKIQSPGGPQAEVYRCRKGYFSKNVQVVSGPNLEIMDIVTGWPGSSHDQTIFNASRICHRLQNGDWPHLYLLGDAGYECRNYILTPLARPESPEEILFNESLIRTRTSVERCFGVLKRRFPILSTGIRVKLDRVDAIITACAVLHNIALAANDTLPAVEDRDGALGDEEDEVAIVPANIGPVNNRRGRYVVRDHLINTWFAALL